MIRVRIHYSDGQYSWSEDPDGDPADTVEVPESVVQLWRAAAELDRVIGAQLLALDNAILERRHAEDV